MGLAGELDGAAADLKAAGPLAAGRLRAVQQDMAALYQQTGRGEKASELLDAMKKSP